MLSRVQDCLKKGEEGGAPALPDAQSPIGSSSQPEKETNGWSEENAQRQVPPPRSEVMAFAAEANIPPKRALRFIDWHNRRGAWFVGGRVIDWKARLGQWWAKDSAGGENAASIDDRPRWQREGYCP